MQTDHATDPKDSQLGDTICSTPPQRFWPFNGVETGLFLVSIVAIVVSTVMAVLGIPLGKFDHDAPVSPLVLLIVALAVFAYWFISWIRYHMKRSITVYEHGFTIKYGVFGKRRYLFENVRSFDLQNFDYRHGGATRKFVKRLLVNLVNEREMPYTVKLATKPGTGEHEIDLKHEEGMWYCIAAIADILSRYDTTRPVGVAAEKTTVRRFLTRYHYIAIASIVVLIFLIIHIVSEDRAKEARAEKEREAQLERSRAMPPPDPAIERQKMELLFRKPDGKVDEKAVDALSRLAAPPDVSNLFRKQKSDGDSKSDATVDRQHGEE